MRLARGPEVGLDAEVDLQRAGPHPQAAARGQDRRLGDLGHAQDAEVEGPARVLAAGRYRELYMVQRECGHAHAYRTAVASGTNGARH